MHVCCGCGHWISPLKLRYEAATKNTHMQAHINVLTFSAFACDDLGRPRAQDGSFLLLPAEVALERTMTGARVFTRLARNV